MTIRLMSWNINSVRLRLDLLSRAAERLDPDIICLQETKASLDSFPYDAIRAMGWPHIHVAGMKGYNGVAILSRHPFSATETLDWCDRNDARHVVARFAGGIELHNLYVPAGGDVPDPDLNEKFAHKLRFLDDLTTWFESQPKSVPRLLVGDLNIAPLDCDVWSHRQLLKVVSHTPIEVNRLERLAASLDWVDAVRRFMPPPEPLFSWWSYRARDWAAADRGRRLDHAWASPCLSGRLTGAEILREARGWPQPSDHVPVMISLEGQL